MKFEELIEKIERGEVDLTPVATEQMYKDFFESVVWEDIRKMIFFLITKERTTLEVTDGEHHMQRIIASQGALAAYRDILDLKNLLTQSKADEKEEGEDDDSRESNSSS